MSPPRIGIWFIGARGGVAATATLGLIGLQKQLTDTVGLVSELPQFAGSISPLGTRFVVGGHEIRDGTLVESVERLHRDSRVFDAALIDACRDELAAIDARIRPGTLWPTAARRSAAWPARDARLRERVGRARRSSGCKPILRAFSKQTRRRPRDRRQPGLDRAGRRLRRTARRAGTISNACSTTAPARLAARQLAVRHRGARPGHALHQFHAIARRVAGRHSASWPAQRSTCHAGQDGKTGETLLKSVLAPMFAARNLEVMSWVGHNIFGNLDGLVLDDPANKAAKIKGKDQLVGNILGYDPQTLVSIEYIRSLGDWKTAWDHIHFRGFLGTPMTLQFTWQGCDSLLAAPLVLDLVRFVELSHRRGEIGVLEPLG